MRYQVGREPGIGPAQLTCLNTTAIRAGRYFSLRCSSRADNASGALSGQAHISRRGRPSLRLAVWRAVWPMLRFNPVMAAKYQALTREADAACAGRKLSYRC